MEKHNCPPGMRLVRWQDGDTLLGIATQNRTTMSAIRAANTSVDFDDIQPGTDICVPSDTPSCPAGQTYTIRVGDTLAAVAQRFGITAGELMERNPYVDPEALEIGQVICTPEADRQDDASPPMDIAPRALGGDAQAPDADSPDVQPSAVPITPLPAPIPNAPSTPPPRPTPPTPTPTPPRPTPTPPRPTPTPPRPTPSPCPTGYTSGTVRYGQTLTDILIRYNLSYQAFTRANPNLTPTRLVPGQRFCLPPSSQRSLCGSGRSYVIGPTETLESIAQTQRLTMQRLLILNPTMAPSDFIAGRAICVP